MEKMTIIPEIDIKNISNVNVKIKRRVVFYARVSTDNEEQTTSYEAQIDYYTRYIKNNDSWEYVGRYEDEGITGCSIKKRPGFNKMIADALSEKFDLIITKSMSRFARNTVDSLQTIRILKEHNVEVFFEKENIWTFDAKGELLITILSSLAQEESRSISENVTWGVRKRFSDGKYSVGFNAFLGFDKGFKIIESEAKIVRFIFEKFLEGYSYSDIKRLLENSNALSPTKKKTWNTNTIKSILQNEKYCGDALLQKCYLDNFLTKRHIKNEGKFKQYYISNSHTSIVSHEIFDLAQKEIEKRTLIRERNKNKFLGKIICKECHKPYYKYTESSSHAIYRCVNSGTTCESKSIDIRDIENAFIKKLNEIIRNRSDFFDYADTIIKTLNIDCMKNNMDILDQKIANTHDYGNDMLKKRHFEKLMHDKNVLIYDIKVCEEQLETIHKLKQNLTNSTRPVGKFDINLFLAFVDKVYVDKNKNITVLFKNR